MSSGTGAEQISMNISLSKGRMESIDKSLVDKIFTPQFLNALGVNKEHLSGIVLGYAFEDMVVFMLVDLDRKEYFVMASHSEAVEKIVKALKEVAK